LPRSEANWRWKTTSGRQIGFPTANLNVHEPHKLIPAYGLYKKTLRVKFLKFICHDQWFASIERR